MSAHPLPESEVPEPDPENVVSAMDGWTNAQKRAWVSRTVGCRPDYGRLSKTTLNSVHAYLTGEFFVSPKRIGTEDSPSLLSFQRAICRHLGFIPCEQSHSGVSHDTPRALPSYDLEALVMGIVHTDDQRGWV